MLATLKLNIAAIAITGMIFTSTITAPFTSMFGKHYDNRKDFSCCKHNQLVIHHYYKFNVLYVPVYDGYTQENVGKSEANGCDIRCTD